MKDRIGALVCILLSFAGMALPGVPLTFALGPDDTVVRFYSHFSVMPIGYGNYGPLFTVIFAAAAVVLILISFKKETGGAACGCLAAALASTAISWLVFQSFSLIGLAVFLLHLAALLLIWIQRHQNII
ncbi:MAG: hypothetical protein HFE85_05350 [Clostridiales bacterium]|nr:hypothetical protein [Clostridiales bacterium]